MTAKLTKRRVDAATAGATIWDGEIKGFGLRVSAKGAKSYVLKYRRGDVQRWYTIGRHGDPWTPETARKEALRLKTSIGEGRDPSTDKTAERQAETFQQFSAKYLEKHASKRKSYAELKRKLDKDILPIIGKLRVKDITSNDIERVLDRMAGRPYSANRILSLLSHMFAKAEHWKDRPRNSNPCIGFEKHPEEARERFLSPKELSRLGRVLRVVDRAGKSPYEVAAIRLLLFTGARLSEILTLKWDYVDFDAERLNLPDSKTGKKSIALPPPALEVLHELPRQEGNDFVICGRKEGCRLVNLQKPWSRIRKAALIPDVRMHDLRHSFASVGASGGMSLPLIGSLLGHKQIATTARYAHLSDDPRKAAASQIAATIAANLNGEASTVVKLRAG